jgi:YHS domain-containing protein
MRTSIIARLALVVLGPAAACGPVVAAGAEGREIPEAFQPFEHMIGRWKGQGIPTTNRLRGWSEKHQWAWKFAKGVPVGMVILLEGDKTLAKAELSYDAASRQYRLDGTTPEGKAVAYAGPYGGTSSSKMLTLARVSESSPDKERIILWPNSNQIRYALWVEHQEPGAPQFKRLIEVGLTKEGEAFAAGGSAADLPKCIITGGAATMTVSYQGKSFPICCSGCRDEFNDDPEKYVKKAALRAEKGAAATAAASSAGSRPGKDDGAFAGFGDEPAPKSRTKPRPADAKAGSAPVAEPVENPKAEATAKDKDEARAASLLRLGQNLEKSGKSAAALPYYQRIMKELPGTAAARTAAARLKALGGQ